MPHQIVYAEIEDNFVNSQNEEFQKSNSPFKQNPDQLGEHDNFKDSELNNDYEHFSSEEDDNNYYILRDNTDNDSTLLILLSIGTLISLGILVNSILI